MSSTKKLHDADELAALRTWNTLWKLQATRWFRMATAAVPEVGNCIQDVNQAIRTLRAENIMSHRREQRLSDWVNDLQAGMYINCVYCGHRYGPDNKVPATMADVLKEHIEQCPEHPLSKVKAELADAELQIEGISATHEENRAQLNKAIEAILEASPYQQRYNGRPSCPFCDEFIDEESTHDNDCIVIEIQGRQREQNNDNE